MLTDHQRREFRELAAKHLQPQQVCNERTAEQVLASMREKTRLRVQKHRAARRNSNMP